MLQDNAAPPLASARAHDPATRQRMMRPRPVDHGQARRYARDSRYGARATPASRIVRLAVHAFDKVEYARRRA